MTNPLMISIALHYWTSPEEYDGGDTDHFHSGAVQGILRDYMALGLLEKREPPSPYGANYKATDGLKVWVEALCNVPLPVKVWVIPTREEPQTAPWPTLACAP